MAKYDPNKAIPLLQIWDYQKRLDLASESIMSNRSVANLNCRLCLEPLTTKALQSAGIHKHCRQLAVANIGNLVDRRFSIELDTQKEQSDGAL